MMTKSSFTRMAAVAVLSLAARHQGWAWDYAGHRIVNQLALASLPTNFPSFTRTRSAHERVAFLAGEPDRWRSLSDPVLRHCNAPDHFLDIDLLEPYRLDPTRLGSFRYEFTAQLALARAGHPQEYPPIDPHQDLDRTRALIGFLPWAITEYELKLESAFSYLKEYESAGTAEEVANARENVLYLMGLMGHYVGDGSQPLHTTKHHHGWVGKNPHHYATNYSIHAWIDGGYIQEFGVTAEKIRGNLRPARPLLLPQAGAGSTNLFQVVMAYLLEQHRQVEPLYRLEKAGKLSGHHEISEEGFRFITGQLLNGAQMLGDLWLTAWEQTTPDLVLRSFLAKRKTAAANGTEPPAPPAP